jgi:endonuclease YncB( thermonuclease family)
MIGGKVVACQGWQYDVYDRLLATCYPAGGKLQKTSFNARMVRDGWAVSYYDYRAEEKAAKAASRGIWAGDFIMPDDWRSSHGRRDQNEVAIVNSIWKWLKSLASKALSCCV